MDLHTASWVDYENDGDQDLLIVVGGGAGTGNGSATKNVFLVNNKESFTDEATKLNLDYPLGRGRMPIWTDINNDGLLDVILVNLPRPDGKAPSGVFIQKNNVFEDVTISSGINIGSATSGQLSDLNLDRNLDLAFLLSSPDPNVIYNLTVFPFKEIRTDLKIPIFNGVYGVSFNDFNGDLLPDLFRSRGTWVNYPYQPNLFEVNTGKGFMDKSKLSGLVEPTSCRSAVSGDFDNDMDVDIFMVCGIWGSPKEDVKYNSDKNLPNVLYENLGNGIFDIEIDAWGAQGSEQGTSETVSIVDFNNDGFLDLFTTNGGGWVDVATGGPHQLFFNKGNNNHWLQIDLIGTKSNRDGIGTRLLVDVDGFTQFREQTGGVHFRTQNEQRIHVGLGEKTLVDSIKIFWPSGIVHELKNVLGDQILQITEPTQPIPPKHQTSLGVDQSKILCKDELKLIINSKMSKVACVKITSWDILKQRGW
jgi:hypothetical protein